MANLSQKDRLHRAKMLARYKSAKQRQLSDGGGENSAKKGGGNDDYDDYVDDDDVENRNLSPNNMAVVTTTTATAACASPISSYSLRRTAATEGTMTTTTTTTTKMTKTPTPMPTPTPTISQSPAPSLDSNNGSRSARAKDRAASIVDAKRKLAASRMAVTKAKMRPATMVTEGTSEKDNARRLPASPASSTISAVPSKSSSTFAGVAVQGVGGGGEGEGARTNDIAAATSSPGRANILDAGATAAFNTTESITVGATRRQQQLQSVVSQRERFQRLRQKQQQLQQPPIASVEKTKTSTNEGLSLMTSQSKGEKKKYHLSSPTPLKPQKIAEVSLISSQVATSTKGGGDKGGSGHISSHHDLNADGRDDFVLNDGGRESLQRQRGNDFPRSSHRGDARSRSFHRADERPQQSHRQQRGQQQIISLASPKSLLLSVLHGTSIGTLIGDLSYDDDEVNDEKVVNDHLGDIDTSIEDKENTYGKRDCGSPPLLLQGGEYTVSISDDDGEFIGELFVKEEDSGVVAARGGVGMIRPQEDSTTTEEGEEATEATGTILGVKVGDANGEDKGRWPADIDVFSPPSWGAPTLLLDNSDKDWYRESWESENRKDLNTVNSGGDKEVKKVAVNDTKSKDNDASSHTNGPGRTVVHDEQEEEEEENLMWNASGDDFGAKKEEEMFEKSMNYGNNEMDQPKEKEVQADQMQSTSCSGSFEWDGIGEEENLSSETDIKSKTKEEDHANEARHNHQLQGGCVVDVKSDCSTAYEGFGTVLDSGALSCKESMDESYDDDNSSSIAAASEGTNGTATAFDPLSMFGEEENFDDEEFVGILDATTAFSASAASAFDSATFGSVFAENTIFPSLINGGGGGMSSTSYAKFPILHQQGNTNDQHGFPLPSPAGSESLESWWQSRYASTQNSDVNSAVQEALAKRVDVVAASSSPPTFPPQPERTKALPEIATLPVETTAVATEITAKISKDPTRNSAIPTKTISTARNNEQEGLPLECLSGGFQAVAAKDSRQEQQPRLQNQSLLSQSDEEDSIFSGLIDDDCSSLPGLAKNHQTRMMKPWPRNPVNNITGSSSPALIVNTRTDEDIFRRRVTSTETEEDVFSGVSVSSQQQLSSPFPRLKESNAMKSLLDDGTVESPSIQQPPKCKKNNFIKTIIPLPAEPARRAERLPSTAHTTLLFSPEDKGYGVIDLTAIEQSPTNASITSDITSSVVFGYAGDSATKKRRQLGILETHHEIVCDATKLHDNDLSNEHDGSGDDNDDKNSSMHSSGGCEKNEIMKRESRGVSLISFSTGDGSSQLSSSTSLQKRVSSLAAASAAAAQAGNGNNKLSEVENNTKNASSDDGGSSQSKFSDESLGSETVNAKLSFLSQLSSCNIFAASSFVYCAGAKDEKTIDENLVNRQEDALVTEGSDKSGEAGQMVKRGNTGSDSLLQSARRGNFTRNGLDSITVSLFNSMSSKGNQGSIQMNGSATQSDSISDSDSDNGSGSSDKEDDDGDVDGDESESISINCNEADEEYLNEGTAPSEEKKSKDGKEEGDSDTSMPERSFDTEAALTQAALTQAGSSQDNERLSVEVNFPLLSSPENVSRVFDRLRNEGIEVLKLNREKNWQPRFLTITAEIVNFGGNDSFPAGLLWVKKFDQAKQHTMASVDKKGKGGIMFTRIDHISVTKDNHALNRKQKKGMFKDSITLALHSIRSGSQREILFRCMSKGDAFALSSGFQAILDRIRFEQQKTNKKRNIGQLKVITTDSREELDSTTPIADRWEL
ncbi:hypothetical protein ACHAW5_007832 [Stephanodiscus triporus]|uniref:Uncharacterized protein n=1 Tax=Stephanodiscus triporus TaxID=2934178 RepID=A0ABD3Q830_9STRA